MKNNDESINNQEVSKQIENSLEILILYRSLYIIKQKFSLFKERIKKIYDKYNIYKDSYKLSTDIKIYQIAKKNFVPVVDEVLKDLNLLIIKYSNPKDIFFSKLILENKIKETLTIIQEILNWLMKNNNGKYSIKHYNKIFFNKKIKQFLQEGENEINITEPNDNDTNMNENENKNKKFDKKGKKGDNMNYKENIDNNNDDFTRILSKRDFVNVCQYNRRGKLIKIEKSKILDENEESGEGVIETIDTNKIIHEYNDNDNNNEMMNKELSININNINESKNSNNSSNININSEKNKKSQNQNKNTNQIVINNDFIFIESLPLILADFLETHLNNAVIESEDELGKELKVLFDNELLKKINEFNNVLKDKSSILKDISIHNLSKEEKKRNDLENALEDLKKIKDNIKIYKDILENKKKLNEDVGYIEKMIEKLLAKEIWLEHRIKLLYEKDKDKYNSNNNTNSTNNLNATNNIGRVTGNTCMSDISSLGNLETNKNLTHNNRIILYNNTNTNKQLNESITNSINTGLINDKSNTSITLNSSKMKINNALQDIFIHYSKQHNIVGYTPLFSTVQQKQFHLDLNEFSKFCIDFRIPIIRQKIVEVFKKSIANFHIMTFKEFKNSLISLANSVHESKKKSITEKISNKKNELNALELKEKQIKEEKKLKRLLYDNNDENIDDVSNSNVKSNTNKSKKNIKSGKNRNASSKANLISHKKEIFNDIANYKINYNKENRKNYQEIVDDFYEFLGLYSKQEYRSKMRGYNMSPVKTSSNLNNQEKSFLSGDGNRSRSFKKDDLEEINKIIENDKNKKNTKQIQDKEKRKLLLYKEKIKLFNINNQRLKLTVDKKMKKKTYLDLMKEQKEEKNEILLMQQQQDNYLKNKLKEKELQKSKEKERLRELSNLNNISCKLEEESKDIENKSKDITRILEKNKHSLDNSHSHSNFTSNNNITNNDYDKNKIINEKEIEQINNINNINNINSNSSNTPNNELIKEEEEEKKKREDKNQIWWEKLETYDINDLGMNEEEKDIFINSDNSEDIDMVSKITKTKQNSNNNSFGGIVLDNSIQKSPLIIDLNKENHNCPIQLPPITSKKPILKNKNNVIELPVYNENNNNVNKINNNSSQNQRTGLYEIKNRIINGNNNNKNDNDRYKNMVKNNSSSLFKNKQISQSEKALKSIKRK